MSEIHFKILTIICSDSIFNFEIYDYIVKSCKISTHKTQCEMYFGILPMMCSNSMFLFEKYDYIVNSCKRVFQLLCRMEYGRNLIRNFSNGSMA